MPLDLTNFDINTNFSLGQIVLEEDLENIGQIGRSNLMHVLAALVSDSVAGDLRSGVLRGFDSALGVGVVVVQPGVGISFYDDVNTEPFEYETAKFVVMDSEQEFVLASEPGSYPRMDVLYMTPKSTEYDTEASRAVVDTTGPTFTPTPLNLRRKFSWNRSWATGTAGSYAVPSIPAHGIPIAYVLRVSAGVQTITDARPFLTLSTLTQAYPAGPITRAGFVVSGCAVTKVSALQVLVSAGIVVVENRRPIRVPAQVLSVGSNAQNIWCRIAVNTDGELVAVNGTAGGNYSHPAEQEAALATVFIPGGTNDIANIIDERKTGKWLRASAFAPQERVAPVNTSEVHFVLLPGGLTGNNSVGYTLVGSLQWADGRAYNPAADGAITVRVEYFLQRASVTANDGTDDYDLYQYRQDSVGDGTGPFVFGIGLGDKTTVFSAYQAPMALWTHDKSSEAMRIHLRRNGFGPNPATYPAITVVVRIERYASDVINETDTSVGNPSVRPLLAADRNLILTPPKYSQTTHVYTFDNVAP